MALPLEQTGHLDHDVACLTSTLDGTSADLARRAVGGLWRSETLHDRFGDFSL
jgi:hypothetical protein